MDPVSAAPTLRPIGRLVIANRGEIACRIIRTSRRLGIETIAVFSDADRHAPHVALADAAYRIGPGEARLSYLDQNAILAVAKQACADAVHPGYGFLAENAEFADACLAAGLIFVGPPPAAIRAMGEKAKAKALMEKAGVPLVPGYHGDDQSPATLRREAERIGYPVLLKASAGGGGKGMKTVGAPGEFDAALASARREAAAAFGDDRMLIERYLARPRHVEVQVFADGTGKCIHLFDRDCSVQRRHQKVIEEAPAPGIPADVRQRMLAAAVSAAQAIGYVGAGTIEFLYSETDRQFYFMEMNTRLQVEHPVTEAITGVDLVAWQLAVAAGLPLPLGQEEIAAHGHAVEARLYAEDPAQDFLPQTGRLSSLILPAAADGVRVDSGVAENGVVSVYYDPMLAKIIAAGPDRAAALRILQRALRGTHVGGLTSNIGLLERVVAHAEFRAGAPDTGFIERNWDDLAAPRAASEETLVAAVAGLVLAHQAKRSAADPWRSVTGWRLNEDPRERLHLVDGATVHEVEIRQGRPGLTIVVAGGAAHAVSGSLAENGLLLEIDGAVRHFLWVRDGRTVTVAGDGRGRFQVGEEFAAADDEGDADGTIRAPMPGSVTAVAVKEGDAVETGQTLLVVEAMKMEHALKAPWRGTVAELRCRLGEQVEEFAELIVLEPADE